MTRRSVVTLPGDGIGRLVLPEALRVLDALGFEADYVEAQIGWELWRREGSALPQRTIELLARHRLGLFGAITSKPPAEAEADLDPALRGRGLRYTSPIVGLRQRFDLAVCLRPCRSFPGNPLNFVRRTAEGGIVEPAVDLVVFRQNTEGLYVGVEWTDPPPAVLEALGSHPGFAPFRATPGADLAISTRIFTRAACRRILAAAFEHARERGYHSVTVCEKPNVLRETSGMMELEAQRIHAGYPEIDLRSTNIDTQMMWLTRNPEELGVIVAGNMFGDIVSDACAGLVGGLGFAASANLGAEVALFEPTHGSAPKYADASTPFVNPIAMILAAGMLLDHVGERARAARLREAVATVVREGRTRTFDMLGLPGGPEVLSRGAASTHEMTDAILAAIARAA